MEAINRIQASSAKVSEIVRVIGDIANAIYQMKEDIVPNGGWKFDHLLAFRKAEVDHTASLSGDARFPIFPPYLVQQIRDAMRPGQSFRQSKAFHAPEVYICAWRLIS